MEKIKEIKVILHLVGDETVDFYATGKELLAVEDWFDYSDNPNPLVVYADNGKFRFSRDRVLYIESRREE